MGASESPIELSRHSWVSRKHAEVKEEADTDSEGRASEGEMPGVFRRKIVKMGE